MSLEELGFVLNKQLHILLRSLFGGEGFVPINCSFKEMAWPTTQNGKIIKQTMFFEMSKLHYNKWEVSQLLEVVVNSLLEVFALRYG